MMRYACGRTCRRWDWNFVRLGLQDVLYDPETKQFYMPNMNQTGGLEQPVQKEGEKIDEN